MAEEIINRLVMASDLRVPARTSSFYFKGKSSTVAEIATMLSVANILEGSVRVSGKRVRVIAQLVRADDGYQVWSQSYDRESRDIFEVQDEIAAAIASTLQISLAGGPISRERGGTRNLDAYRIYLQAQSSVTADSTTATIEATQSKLRQQSSSTRTLVLLGHCSRACRWHSSTMAVCRRRRGLPKPGASPSTRSS